MICIDDFADSPEFTRQSKLLHHLYIRIRHQCISTITSTHVYKIVSPVVRKSLAHQFVFRLRNANDLEAWIEELSGVYDKKALHQLYSIATQAPHRFLYINLMSKNKEDLFYIQFMQKMIRRG